MEAKFTGSILVATFLISSATTLPAEAQTSPSAVAFGGNRSSVQPVATVFRCVQKRNGFATVAQRGDRTTPPVITWRSTLGRQYNPQKRCSIVSQRLTHTVARNGGKLRNLQLIAGPVKNQVVICVVNKGQYVCNNSNMLFTLRQENARRPDEIVAMLNNFSFLGNGDPVAESEGLDSFALEKLNRFLGSEENEL